MNRKYIEFDYLTTSNKLRRVKYYVSVDSFEIDGMPFNNNIHKSKLKSSSGFKQAMRQHKLKQWSKQNT